jgi:hypothetical protein
LAKKHLLLDKLPLVGFILFVYGMGMVVAGVNWHSQAGIVFDVFGIFIGALGFFLFGYGNMLLDELNEQ